MKLKLDENLSHHLKNILIGLNHNITTAADEGLLSQSDTIIASAAKAEERILLTLDIEFGDLRKYPPGSHPGIILFRPRSFGPLSVNKFIEEFIRNTDLNLLTGCIAVVEPARMRMRCPSDNE